MPTFRGPTPGEKFAKKLSEYKGYAEYYSNFENPLTLSVSLATKELSSMITNTIFERTYGVAQGIGPGFAKFGLSVAVGNLLGNAVGYFFKYKTNKHE